MRNVLEWKQPQSSFFYIQLHNLQFLGYQSTLRPEGETQALWFQHWSSFHHVELHINMLDFLERVRGHCVLNPARFGLDLSTVEEGAGWAGGPALGLASSDWQMLLSLETVVFHLLGLMAHTVTDKGQQTSCLWSTQKWMQTNAKQNQKAFFFSLVCSPNETVTFSHRMVSSYLSTTPTVQPQVLTWNVLYLTFRQFQFLNYCRESKINVHQRPLWQRWCMILWAYVHKVDRCQIFSYIIYTPYISVHIPSPILV